MFLGRQRFQKLIHTVCQSKKLQYQDVQIMEFLRCAMDAKRGIGGIQELTFLLLHIVQERNPNPADKYSANEVRPGLTGLAQICGESEPLIPKKAKLDGIYIEKMSFVYDLKVALKTIVSIIKR